MRGDGAEIYRELVDALCIPFEDRDIKRAIADCVERNARWIYDYFEAQFDLGSASLFPDPEDEERETSSPPHQIEPLREEGGDGDNTGDGDGQPAEPGGDDNDEPLTPTAKRKRRQRHRPFARFLRSLGFI